MAMKIGAKTQMMDLGKIYPNGMEVAPGIAKSTIWSNKAAFEDHMPALWSTKPVSASSASSTRTTILRMKKLNKAASSSS